MQERLYEAIEKDNVEALRAFDLIFSQNCTELAVKNRAYKCLGFLLASGTKLSPFCFLRACENNDNSFFLAYGYLFPEDASLAGQVLSLAYKRDAEACFDTILALVEANPSFSRAIKPFVASMLADPMRSFKEADYLAKVAKHVPASKLLRQPELLGNRPVQNKVLRKAILEGIKLPLGLRYKRTCFLTEAFTDEHLDVVKHYSTLIRFRGDPFVHLAGYRVAQHERRKLFKHLSKL